MISEPRNKRVKFSLVGIGTFLLLTLITIVVLIAVYYDSYSYPNDYAVVFDAGSSSSKMYIYSWKSGLSANKGHNVTISEIGNCFKSPGIDKLKTKDDTIIYFNDCLQNASKTIPNERKSRAHIVLAATAGMRLLNVSDSNQTQKILGFIRDHFAKSEFLFKSNDQVKILTGKEEGLYAWISANYFANKFTTKTDPTTTVGILDLGGASTQISFVPSSKSENNTVTNDFYEKARILGVDYSTYSHSFLCWGVNQIQLVYQTYLLIKNNYTEQVNAACFNTNATINFTTASIVGSNCANGRLFNFPNGIDLTTLGRRSFYILNGVSDPIKCQEEMAILFPDDSCPYGSNKCSFDKAYLPPITNKNTFYAFTNFYYKLANTESLSNKKLKKDLNGYATETQNLCSLNYSDLTAINKKLSSPINDDFLKSTCFFNYYLLKMFNKYKITNFDNIEFMTTVNGNTIGWSLGYMIDLVNREDFLPYEAPPRKLQPEFFIPAITIASIFTVLAFISILVCLFGL
ncbi:unnamed protein product [Brachionus calyciflorus]|uniref:Ectonucleoside triphosphate diphosphohydrolase 1 n=1 Tax=Brachionus calyciflorus TaxID=104777 RepID=A0A813P8I7_9BILA|nr:unnamed protein product [Brachionus calyciflorus]